MATMLAFITTDAAAENEFLKDVLKKAVERSFNRITIDGDMSTNDSVILLANGNSGVEIASDDKKLSEVFYQGLQAVCQYLAKKCVSDGEKVTKLVKAPKRAR